MDISFPEVEPVQEATPANNGSTSSKVTPKEILSGTLPGTTVLNIGDKNVQIDAANRRILIYDENGDARVLIGYQENGF